MAWNNCHATLREVYDTLLMDRAAVNDITSRMETSTQIYSEAGSNRDERSPSLPNYVAAGAVHTLQPARIHCSHCL